MKYTYEKCFSILTFHIYTQRSNRMFQMIKLLPWSKGVCPPSYAENLTSKVMALEDGVFGRRSGHKVEPS